MEKDYKKQFGERLLKAMQAGEVIALTEERKKALIEEAERRKNKPHEEGK